MLFDCMNVIISWFLLDVGVFVIFDISSVDGLKLFVLLVDFIISWFVFLYFGVVISVKYVV